MKKKKKDVFRIYFNKTQHFTLFTLAQILFLTLLIGWFKYIHFMRLVCYPVLLRAKKIIHMNNYIIYSRTKEKLLIN